MKLTKEEATRKWQSVVDAETRKCGNRLIALARCRGSHQEVYRAMQVTQKIVEPTQIIGEVMKPKQLELFPEDDAKPITQVMSFDEPKPCTDTYLLSTIDKKSGKKIAPTSEPAKPIAQVIGLSTIDRPLEPTEHPPGSAGKLEVLRQRAELGLPLFVPGDNAQAIFDGHRTFINCPNVDVIREAQQALEASLAARRAERCG